MKTDYYLIQVEKVANILSAIKYSEKKISNYARDTRTLENVFLFTPKAERQIRAQKMRLALVRLHGYYYNEAKKLIPYNY